MPHLCESCLAEVWKVLQIGMTCCLSFSLISRDSSKELATRSRASSGHGCQGRERGGIGRRIQVNLWQTDWNIDTYSILFLVLLMPNAVLHYILYETEIAPSWWWFITWNQSMVQQLISDGNWRRRFLKASPMGLKATIICKFSLQRATKNANRVSGLSSKFLLPAWAMGRTAWRKRDEVTDRVNRND